MHFSPDRDLYMHHRTRHRTPASQGRQPGGWLKPPCPCTLPPLAGTWAWKASGTHSRWLGMHAVAGGLDEGPRGLCTLPAWASPGTSTLGGSNTPIPFAAQGPVAPEVSCLAACSSLRPAVL